MTGDKPANKRGGECNNRLLRLKKDFASAYNFELGIVKFFTSDDNSPRTTDYIVCKPVDVFLETNIIPRYFIECRTLFCITQNTFCYVPERYFGTYSFEEIC